jgi:hypothetical protein
MGQNQQAWKEANPWVIQNLQNGDARCGRYPSREAAEAAAASYRGGVVSVNESAKVVYVSEIPNL